MSRLWKGHIGERACGKIFSWECLYRGLSVSLLMFRPFLAFPFPKYFTFISGTSLPHPTPFKDLKRFIYMNLKAGHRAF